MAFPTRIYADYGMEKKTGSTKYHSLGTILELPDGREYKYALAGGVALGQGATVASAAPVGNHDMDLVTPVNAAGSSTYKCTLGATASTKNQYADGYVYTNDGTGEGQIYRIDSHDAVDSAGEITLNLAENDKVVVATVATTLSGLHVNPYSGVVISPATVVTRTVGVPPTAIAADEYGWVQTKGLASVLIGGTTELGEPVRVHGNGGTAGAIIGLIRGGSNEDEQEVGVMLGVVAVSGDYGLVFLNID